MKKLFRPLVAALILTAATSSAEGLQDIENEVTSMVISGITSMTQQIEEAKEAGTISEIIVTESCDVAAAVLAAVARGNMSVEQGMSTITAAFYQDRTDGVRAILLNNGQMENSLMQSISQEINLANGVTHDDLISLLAKAKKDFGDLN